MKKAILLVSIIILVAGITINIFSKSQPKVSTETFEGNLKNIAGQWFLMEGEDFFQLELAPESFLNEQNIQLKNKKKIKLTGTMENEVVTVFTVLTDEFQIVLRDEYGMVKWNESIDKIYYKVNKKKCISCRLCVKYCPFDAIEMVNGIAVIDVDKCTACGICVVGNNKNFKGCPTSAIKRIE